MNSFERIQASIKEYWSSFLDKVPELLLGLIVLVLSFFIATWIAGFIQKRISGRISDPLLSNFLIRAFRFLLIILGIMLAFHIMGFTGIAGSLLAGAGLGALIIGFAFQDIGANFLGGIILAFNRPFNIGDTIEVEGHMGTVVKLDLRVTQIKTFEGKDIFIPNNTLIKEELINFTRDGYIRLWFTVGIDYDDDVDHAQQVILQATRKVPKVLQTEERKPVVLIKELSVSTINLEIRFWMETFDYRLSTLQSRTEVIKAVLKDLKSSGIGLPADIVELKHYKGEGFPVKVIRDDPETP